MATDWVTWHSAYDAADSPLAQRLAIVRQLVEDAVDSHEGRRLRVLSICAGDGRDVLPVLASWRGKKEISGRLVERDPELADRAQHKARSASLERVEVVCGDAALPANYAGSIPADLLLLCGVLGNISDLDVQHVVAALPALCAPRASVVWTRHRRSPDLTPKIRNWFATAGFIERAFRSPGPNEFSVGRHQFIEQPSPAELGQRSLFTFIR